MGFWIGIALYNCFECVIGNMSYNRPACDIFIAGTTQLPSTIYMVMALLISRSRIEYLVIVHYTDYSMATINTCLHFVLLICWSSQGIELLHVCRRRSKNKYS